MSQNLQRRLQRKKKQTQAKEAKAETKKIPYMTDLGESYNLPNVPVSVTIIARDCAESLERTLYSLRAQFVLPCDEILVLDTGSQDAGATKTMARRYGARVIERPDLRKDYREKVRAWCPEHECVLDQTDYRDGGLLDFAEARQIVSDAAKHDIQLWIDSDDTLQEKNPGHLRATVNKYFTEGSSYCQLFLDYIYSRDPSDGSVTSILKRERIIDRRYCYWKGRCHETAIPREHAGDKRGTYFQDLQSVIEHNRNQPRDWDKINPSDLRNYVILRNEREETKNGYVDPRTTFYLGNAARGIHHNAEAIELYKEFLPTSGSRDDRYAATYYVATLFVGPMLRRPIDALDWYFKCIRLKPEDPRGYFGIQRAYFQMGRYNEAMHWFKVGRMLPEPTACVHNYDPRHIHVLPLQIAALTCEKMDHPEGVKEFMDQLIQASPGHTETEELKKHLGNWLAGKRLEEGVGVLLANASTQAKGDRMALQDIGRSLVARLPHVPATLERRGLAKMEPEDPREGKDLVFYAGAASEPWGPKSGETGIGGSEKATIMMAPRLQKRGFRVTVYADVPVDQRGIDDSTGVNWQHFGSFDYKRPRGTVIFWRSPELLEAPIRCEKRILWCHDVQNPGRWNAQRVGLADQVWVLSDYHALTLGPVGKELGDRLIVTRNGIEADLFQRYYGKVERDPKKVIYASSPDRGILTAIKVFQAADVPGSTLDLYYGFTKLYMDNASKYEYWHIPDKGADCNAYEYLQEVLHTVDQDDRITFRGRVGWEELAREMCQAGVWLYPTRFPEISCMGAMEAQAAGMIPVHTGDAALKETVFSGFLISADSVNEAAKALRGAMGDNMNETREDIHKEACKRFDYEALADEWTELINKD